MRDLAKAFAPVAWDMASSLFLVLLIALHADAAMALGASVVFALAQIGFQMARRHAVAPLQWASLGLVLVFGGAGLAFHDLRFLMTKPTVVELIVAAVMLKRGWMTRYLPPIVMEHGEDLAVGWGYAWAGMMALLAVSNLVVAVSAPNLWVAYKSTVPTFAPLGMFLVQYASMRVIIGRRIGAKMSAQAQAA
jgi:intracellular septation protein